MIRSTSNVIVLAEEAVHALVFLTATVIHTQEHVNAERTITVIAVTVLNLQVIH